jgi:hypothetical protein
MRASVVESTGKLLYIGRPSDTKYQKLVAAGKVPLDSAPPSGAGRERYMYNFSARAWEVDVALEQAKALREAQRATERAEARQARTDMEADTWTPEVRRLVNYLVKILP